MAISQGTVSGIGSGVSDIFAGFAEEYKIQGDKLEAENYRQAAALARENEQYTEMSTAIQEAQQQRQVTMAIGKEQQEVAGAGFAASGSALDILRSSIQQGALQKAVLGEQGLITEAGYKEQAQSYDNMAAAADAAVKGDRLAQIGDFVAAGVNIVGGLAMV